LATEAAAGAGTEAASDGAPGAAPTLDPPHCESPVAAARRAVAGVVTEATAGVTTEAPAGAGTEVAPDGAPGTVSNTTGAAVDAMGVQAQMLSCAVS